MPFIFIKNKKKGEGGGKSNYIKSFVKACSHQGQYNRFNFMRIGKSIAQLYIDNHTEEQYHWNYSQKYLFQLMNNKKH